MPKFVSKNALFRLFWAIVLKHSCHIRNQHPQTRQKKSLTHTGNFGIGSAFYKGPGSAFSEGPGPGPGPLYKVFRLKEDKICKTLN